MMADVKDPYADKTHRKGCGCGALKCTLGRESDGFALSLDAAFDADQRALPACRKCKSWKRRDPHVGTCWHPDQPVALQHQQNTCPRFEARAIHVERAAS